MVYFFVIAILKKHLSIILALYFAKEKIFFVVCEKIKIRGPKLKVM
jgi:hypothetical protein